MTKVDAKGRIVLPKGLRDRLGLSSGSEVAVHEEDGRVVIQPEDDPEDIVSDLEALIASATGSGKQTPYDQLDPQSRDHVDAIRRQAVDADE